MMKARSFGNILVVFAAVALMSVAMSSCGTSKKVLPSAPQSPVESAGVPSADLGAMIQSYAPAWRQVRIPVSVNVAQPMTVGASGYITMTRGESISISMRVLGMEVASLYLTSDSVVVIDRWNKRYISQSLTKFLNGFPVTIDNVQDLLLGRIFLVGQSGLDVADVHKFVCDSEGELWGCKPARENDLFGYAFVATGRTLMYLNVSAGKGGAEVSYAAPVETPCGIVSSGLTVKSKAGKKDIDATLTYKPQKAQWDGDVKVSPFTIPKGYKKVDAESVLKGLKKP